MGNPSKPHNLKVIQGTSRKDRDAPPAVDLALVDGIPSPPDWLPNTYAIKEWQRLAPILIANRLLTQASTSTLAHLCALHGKLVQLLSAGQTPTSAMLAQYRGLSNDFGLTPVAQGRVKPNSGGRPANVFSKNGKRPTHDASALLAFPLHNDQE